ncbi:hypothetical protein ANO14919_038400 [Xylariales sp. No.14919]|nr:hypothetical protein ANO14919_038400 [Xylariales sp. No.14919]
MFEPVGNLHLTVHERTVNSEQILGQLARYWDAFSQGGFTATDGAGNTPVFHVLNWPEDGNSLWYCLCYTTYLFRSSTPEWAWVKAQIWKYFNYVIHHPSHPRHRMYVHLERQSPAEIEQRSPGSRRLWGRMSILRALHLNTPDSGPPMYGNFYGMMQVIADFFRKEVILFIRPKDAKIDVLRPEYDYRVFGRRADGQTNGQLYFVTDEVPEHFQIVTTMDQVLVDYRSRTGQQDPPNPGGFDTSHRSSNDRYGWIDGPWMPLVPLPDGYEPIPLANPPMLDPLFTLPFNTDECWQFSGRGEAVDNDPRYGMGAMPILPDPVTSGWATETLAPVAGPAPYPEFPYQFSRHNIVTGVYVDQNREWWPQWNSMLAYKANEYRELARVRDLPTEPHVLSQP